MVCAYLYVPVGWVYVGWGVCACRVCACRVGVYVFYNGGYKLGGGVTLSM